MLVWENVSILIGIFIVYFFHFMLKDLCLTIDCEGPLQFMVNLIWVGWISTLLTMNNLLALGPIMSTRRTSVCLCVRVGVKSRWCWWGTWCYMTSNTYSNKYCQYYRLCFSLNRYDNFDIYCCQLNEKWNEYDFFLLCFYVNLIFVNMYNHFVVNRW